MPDQRVNENMKLFGVQSQLWLEIDPIVPPVTIATNKGTGKSLSAQNSLPSAIPPWGQWPYRIGCPVWGCKSWSGIVYPEKTKSADYLTWYSRMFPTVEGNSTFYSVPGPDLFARWCESTQDGFQFCFKFPRQISHDAALQHCEREMAEWQSRLEILARYGRLGPTFLQLAPSFSSRSFAQLAQFLKSLRVDWPWAVEVRHPDWFDGGLCETRLNTLLRDHQIDRVLFDSRPLNALEASDPHEVQSQSRKPKLPLCTTVTGARPMVRLIGRNTWSEVESYWDEWAIRIADWIQEGKQPWVFTHAPDDTYAPELAQALHEKVRARVSGLCPLPDLSALIRVHAGPDDRAQGSTGGHVQLRLF